MPINLVVFKGSYLFETMGYLIFGSASRLDAFILTGKNAGGASIGVLWGYGDRAELLEAEADAYVSDMKELMRELLARTKI